MSKPLINKSISKRASLKQRFSINIQSLKAFQSLHTNLSNNLKTQASPLIKTKLNIKFKKFQLQPQTPIISHYKSKSRSASKHNKSNISISLGKQRKSNFPSLAQSQSQSLKKQNFPKIKKSLENNSKSFLQKAYQYKSQQKLIKQKQRQFYSKSIKTNLKKLVPIKQKQVQKQSFLKIIRHEFHSLINSSNNLKINNQKLCFRAYIEKGNNGLLIKQILKKRWWWHIQDTPGKANLIWTQWHNVNITNQLQTIYGQFIQIDRFNDYKSHYRSSQKQSSIFTKSNYVRQLVDDQMFEKIKESISLKKINYFQEEDKSIFKKIDYHNLNTNQKDIAKSDVIHNHLEGCLNLHSKKLMFKNFLSYTTKHGLNVWNYIPLTFYIDSVQSSSYKQFFQKYDQFNVQNKSCKNIWIIKPGSNSNQGYGIKVLRQKNDIKQQIKSRVGQNHKGLNNLNGIIVQKYIQKCFLINKRKFDIRCYLLITTVNGHLKGYWYKQGYLRTCSEEYCLDDTSNLNIHLTNDSIQKKNNTYGKFQDHNKMSYQEFKRYLQARKKVTNQNKQQQFNQVRNSTNKKKLSSALTQSTFDKIYEQMKKISYYLICSIKDKIKRKQYTFELFGLDFMIDDKLSVYLIECNSNPSLDCKGILLGRLIRELIDNVIMTSIDPIFKQPNGNTSNNRNKQEINRDYFASNKFELIYSDRKIK